jgi:adenylate kinase
MLRLILLGPPGAGKGTQAARIAKDIGVPHISTGVILREAVSAGSDLGKKAKAVMDQGNLVSDKIMLGIIRERLAQPDCAEGFILDGYPRTIPQAESLDELLSKSATPPVALMNLALDEEELRQRIAGRRTQDQRSDDNEDTVIERFKVYQEKTRPLLEYYGERVTNIDGKGSIEDVFRRLSDELRAAARGAGR